MLLVTGTVLRGRYRIDALLGQGGMGAVHRAWDMNLKMPVAVKVNYATSQEAQRQFEREAGMLARLSHPNLPRVTDYFFMKSSGWKPRRLRRGGKPALPKVSTAAS